MTRVTKLLLLLAALAPAFMAAPCAAAGLRGEVLLDKETLTVADIFGDAAGEAGTQVIGPAPAPGEKLSYDVGALMQVAKNYHVAWTPSGNYEKVIITRASQRITAEMVRDRVAAEIGATVSEKNLDIALDNANLEIHRPTGETLDWHIADLSYDPIKHRFAGSLIVGGAGSATADVTKIGGRAMPTVQVAVLNRALPAGSKFTEAAIDWQSMPVDRAGADAITTPDQLKGVESRRVLEAKSILRLRDTANARLITKGSLVEMQIKTAAMQISAQGRALSDAVMGETVRVLNTQSNRTVDAVVTGDGKVSVTPALASPALANHVAAAE